MGHLLVMTNHHTKLEEPWAMSSLVSDRTRFVYGWTDRPTYLQRPTDRHVKNNIPPLLRRGHNKGDTTVSQQTCNTYSHILMKSIAILHYGIYLELILLNPKLLHLADHLDIPKYCTVLKLKVDKAAKNSRVNINSLRKLAICKTETKNICYAVMSFILFIFFSNINLKGNVSTDYLHSMLP